MRDEAPVYFDETSGLWGVSRYDDVVAVSRDTVRFSSAGGSRPDTGPLPWMIDLDGTDHTKRRTIVSAGFTPKRVRATEPQLTKLVDDDFGAWAQYAAAMTDARRRDPADDLWSALVHAEVDGERLRDDEIAMEALLLFIGGDETTRQVAAGGLEQLVLHDQRPDNIPATVEEMLRWVSPIKNMARTTTRATEIAGTRVPAATKLIVLYESANFDERHFPEPDVFDVHVLFERVLTRLPDITLAGEPRRSIAGIESMTISFSPKPRI